MRTPEQRRILKARATKLDEMSGALDVMIESAKKDGLLDHVSLADLDKAMDLIDGVLMDIDMSLSAEEEAGT